MTTLMLFIASHTNNNKNMRHIIPIIVLGILCVQLKGQTGASPEASADHFVGVKQIACTPIKNQSNTGTCWSFSTTSLIESQCMSAGLGEFDLSEMFIVRNIYLDKARNYMLRQGA